jgi:hypothetical protein
VVSEVCPAISNHRETEQKPKRDENEEEDSEAGAQKEVLDRPQESPS